MKIMYFGTRGFMQMVPVEAIDGDHSKVGWQAKSQYLNGGAGVRKSKASHREYVLSWNLTSRDAIRPITDYADGIYDTSDGTNLIYFHDPMVLDKNVLPQMWATPSQVFSDGLALFPGQSPTATMTPTNALGYPARSAQYAANSSSASIWVPIPPGYVAWIGAHGTAMGAAGVTAATTLGLAAGTPTTLTLLPVTSETRVNASYAASGSVDGIMLAFANGGPGSTDTLTLSGLMVQILEVGVVPETGGFISGQGHSGCEFESQPTVSPHSAAMDKVAVSAKLVEIGSWL